MDRDPMSPKVLVRVANEIEATAIVGVLADHGIRARSIGGYTSGFRAEAPGAVSIVVGQADVERATELLAQVRQEHSQTESPTVEPRTRRPRFHFQFRISTLLALQTLVSLAMAFWTTFRPDRWSAVVWFGLSYLVFVAATLALVVAGTVGFASNLSRGRQAWGYVGRALSVGIAVLALMVFIPWIAELLRAVR